MPKPILTLFLTRDMSLKKWDNLGLLNREMALYKELMHSFSIQIFSYGNVSDLYYESLYSDLKVLIIPYYQRTPTFKNKIHRWKALNWLRKSHLFKTNQIPGAEHAIYFGKKYNIPVITRCGYLHSTFIQKQSSNQNEIRSAFQFEKEMFEQGTIGVTSSQRDRTYVIQSYNLSDQKVQCIPNYVDQSVFKPGNIPKEEGHIVFVGRLSEQKNLFSFLDAVQLSKRVKKVTMIGDGPLRSALEQKAKEITNVDIQFLGKKSNSELPSFLQKSSVYILPSFYEGLPKTLLEAMACGCACIGTDVEGIREVLTHTVDGYLTKTDPESMAQAIDIVLSDKNMQEKIGTNAINTITSNYGLSKIVQLEKQCYEQIIS